jgi:hypothetical protein
MDRAATENFMVEEQTMFYSDQQLRHKMWPYLVCKLINIFVASLQNINFPLGAKARLWSRPKCKLLHCRAPKTTLFKVKSHKGKASYTL